MFYQLMRQWQSDGTWYAHSGKQHSTVEEARKERDEAPDYVIPLRIVKVEVVE